MKESTEAKESTEEYIGSEVGVIAVDCLFDRAVDVDGEAEIYRGIGRRQRCRLRWAAR